MPKGRILTVDDQRYFRELIGGMLTEEGFEVESAPSGEEALRILDHSSFDVVVTDLIMPVMTGTELVQRIKERDPDQLIVVVTGVVDVRSAVDAMKLGATDYLLKPFDAASLTRSLESILQRRRLSAERDRLLAENIEYLGDRSLFARTLSLFRSVSLEDLAQKVLEALCEETGAQGGVLWMGIGGNEGGFRIGAARGLVRLDEEPAQLDVERVDPALRTGATTLLAGEPTLDTHPILWVALRRAEQVIGLLRLTDKVGESGFDAVDRATVERFMEFAEAAFANADRYQALERRVLQDPDTGAYHIDYLRGVLRNEIEKANRFGRSFGLLRLGLVGLESLRSERGDSGFRRWLNEMTRYLARQLRSTDLLATDGAGGYWALIPESDAIGIASFKRRLRVTLSRCEALVGLDSAQRPKVAVGVATCPGDGPQLDTLLRVLDDRVARDSRGSRDVELDALPLAGCLQRLLETGDPEVPEGPASLVRFALAELGRLPRERNLFFFHPGPLFGEALETWLLDRRGGRYRTDVVAVAKPPGTPREDDGIAWVSPERVEGCPPFLVHFGDGPAYAMVCGEKPGPEGLRLFHTGDRDLVEYLAFRLQRELGVPRLS